MSVKQPSLHVAAMQTASTLRGATFAPATRVLRLMAIHALVGRVSNSSLLSWLDAIACHIVGNL